LVVLDQPTLIYYPVGIIFDYGIQEIRGPAFSSSTQIPVKLGDYDSSVTARWKSLNYSGFYFDPEDMLGDETLVLYSVQDRRVSPPSNPVIYEENNTAFQKGFQYTTLLQPKEFEFKPWGYYLVINFLGMQWFAGYDSSLMGTKASKSLLEKEYLGRVLIDEEYQGVAFVGNYSLQEGYEIRIRDLENDSIFLELLKDGASIEGSVVRSNSTYIYEKDLGDVDDLPIIMVHVDNVFNNISKGFATIDAIFQISDQFIIPVEEGNGIGEMQIVNVDPLGIMMVNDDSIN
jgi:S-layer protein (TIGR01567 family)